MGKNMIEAQEFYPPLQLHSISIRSDDDIQGSMKDEYCGYEIVLVADNKRIVIHGCHDYEPEFVDNA